jgi:hypothetical protein
MLRNRIEADTNHMPETVRSRPKHGEMPPQSLGNTTLAPPHPARPRVGAGLMYAVHKALEPNRVWRGLAHKLEQSPRLYRAFAWAEERTKRSLFGCRMCAQCALPTTAYSCPQTCPKQLRNGPCGGAYPNGGCEVYPEMKCVWVEAYDRAVATGHIMDLRRQVRPIDNQRWGESSWVNYWLDRDEHLWTEDDALTVVPPTL